MDPENAVVALCAEGMEAEARGELDAAKALFEQAWEARGDDVDACIAAHHVARHQPTAADVLRWNQRALDHADAAGDERAASFYPSLYLNMGWAHELMEQPAQARRCYVLAAGSAEQLRDEAFGEVVMGGVAAGLQRIAAAT